MLTFQGAYGTDVRPARKASGRKAWAKDRTAGNDDGTRLDATFVNDVKGLIVALCEAYGITQTEGDDSLLVQAIAAALDGLELSEIDGLQAALDLKAPLANPVLTGDVIVPNQTLGNNTTKAANTAFVQAAIAALINSAPGALDTLDELAAAFGDDANFATTMTNALALKAPLASPSFSGAPTTPDAADGADTTQIANTKFVQRAITLLKDGVSGSYDTLAKIVTLIGLKLNAANPALSGSVTHAGAAATFRLYNWYSGATARWSVGADNVAEAGSDAGSDLVVWRYNDAGSFVDQCLRVIRSTGVFAFLYSPTGPHPDAADDSTKLATTGWVQNELAALGGVPAAEDIAFTPAGGTAATNVQAAIEEVRTEAQAAAEAAVRAGVSGTYDTLAEIETKLGNLDTDIAGKAASAHTHTIANVTSLQASLDAKAEFYSGSTANNTSFPIGSIILMEGIGVINRNATIAATYDSGGNQKYITGGIALSGTWRQHGFVATTPSACLAQRTA